LGWPERFFTRLVYLQKSRVWGRAVSVLLIFRGTEFLAERIGPGLRLGHCGTGTIVTPKCHIGANVTIMNNVTIGRADIWRPPQESWAPIVIEDDVILSVGARVLGRGEGLVVGRGSVVGANSVLTQSTGEYEIWAGSPARKIGMRT
jgi:serine O-acetyltransferase